ncbi:phosphopantetheine-binding protein [Streptomyces sp. NPDC005892]|uniref:acyl carrier protein n=1 Tax=Streptomyces sp. NPDC005892 TaxID=3155593 RepID=UPI0033C30909
MEDGAMYDMLTRLLVEEFGLDEDQVRPDATARQLELDSLSVAELAVIVTEATGVRLEDVEVNPDTTLGQMAEAFDRARSSLPAAPTTPAAPAMPATPATPAAPTSQAAPAAGPSPSPGQAPPPAPAPSFDQALSVAPAQS